MNTPSQSSPGVLSQPLTLPNGAVVKNRLFKSAMSEALGTRKARPRLSWRACMAPGPMAASGLCITGNVMIDRGAGRARQRGDRGRQHLPELQAWAQAATRNGTQCWVQLNHPGKQAPKGLNKENVAPSAVPFRDDMQAFFPTPRELTAPRCAS
jgi:2,4-dienoyl-CoA reductase-like NADH-dependent reductase (Old Yellow Enzyme family)